MTIARIVASASLAPIALAGTLSAASGPLDTHFGIDGVAIISTAPGSGPDFQNGLAVQRDGKALVGGESDLGDAGGFRWRITRLDKKGKPDPSFGSGGTVLTNMSNVGGFDERLIALTVQRDGKIVAVGYILTAPDVQNSALARYNPDGSPDTSFGNGGVVVTDVASEPDHDFINQVTTDSMGRIVVAGGCRSVFVGRYLSNGTLDASFNAAGPRPGLSLTELAASGETNSEILGMALDDEERIVGAAYSTFFDGISFHVDSAIVRFLPAGTLDGSFNPTGPRPGVVIHELSPGFDVFFRVALDKQGRILGAGDAFVGVGAGGFDVSLVRFLPDGRLDDAFGIGGVVLTNLGPGDSDDDAQGVAVQPDGHIVLAGSAAPTAFTFDSDFAVARFQSDGSLDESFGDGGIAITPTAPGTADDEIFAAAFQTPSKLIASGECDQLATGRDACVVRYKLGGNDD